MVLSLSARPTEKSYAITSLSKRSIIGGGRSKRNIWNFFIDVVSISMTDICGDIQESAAPPGRNGFFLLVPVARATG